MLFKDPSNLSKAFFHINRIFKFKNIQFADEPFHPGATFVISHEHPFHLSLIQQSSNNTIHVWNGEKCFSIKAAFSQDIGIFGKIGVHNFAPITTDLSKNQFQLKPIRVHNWKPDVITKNQVEFFKTFLVSFYENDLILENGKIKVNTDYNFFVDRVLEAYTNNTLSPELKDSVRYVLDFAVQNNFIENGEWKNSMLLEHRIKAWNYLVKSICVKPDGLVFFPENEIESLPVDVKFSIEMIKSLTNQ